MGAPDRPPPNRPRIDLKSAPNRPPTPSRREVDPRAAADRHLTSTTKLGRPHIDPKLTAPRPPKSTADRIDPMSTPKQADGCRVRPQCERSGTNLVGFGQIRVPSRPNEDALNQVRAGVGQIRPGFGLLWSGFQQQCCAFDQDEKAFACIWRCRPNLGRYLFVFPARCAVLTADDVN